MKRLSGIITVLLGACLYGGLNSIVKLAYQAGYTFSQVTYSQYFYGSVIIILLVIGSRGFRLLSVRTFLLIAIIGIIGLGGTSLFLYGSLNHLPTSIALVLLFQFAWISLLMERFILKKKINRLQILSVIVVLIGTFFVLQIFDIGSLHLSWIGVICGLLAAVSYSVFLIGASLLPDTVSQVYKTAIMTVVTFALLTIGFVVAVPIHDINPLSGIWRWGLLLGIVGQILPPLLFTYGAPIVGGTATAILGTAELPVGVILSSLIVHEPITFLQGIGVVLIVLGMVMGSLSGVNPSQENEEGPMDLPKTYL